MRKFRFTSLTVVSLIAILAVSAVMWVGCSNDSSTLNAPVNTELSKAMPGMGAEMARVMSVQDRYTDAMMKVPGVVGTATGFGADGRPRVKIFAARAGVVGVPATLDGVPVDVVVTGEFKAMALTGRYRPVPIGVSVGNNKECAAGTIGCVVLKGGQKYILSNNHVLARENKAALGEVIVQPGRYDNKPICTDKSSTDKVATLSDFQTIKFDGTANTIDAAIAIYTTTSNTCSTPSGYYGFPGSTVVSPSVGLAIKKVGRTTSLTTGTITAINATVNVGYSSGTAKFTGQFITSKSFCKAGDSGSLVVTNNSSNNPVGLLFAGTSDGTTICNPIGSVFSRFAVSVCTN